MSRQILPDIGYLALKILSPERVPCRSLNQDTVLDKLVLR